MPRPRRCRRVGFQPGVNYFKPAGVKLRELETVTLKVEELEALRLKDFEGKEQTEAAEAMNVSQPTFHRILLEARKKVTEALVKGRAIKIEGGNYKMPGKDGTGPLGQGPGIGAGRGIGRGRGFGGPTACKCPDCGHEHPHTRGTPCTQIKCERCGKIMVRGN
ncbi:MAG: DUF134 domain-containing protein [archaeon]